VIAVGPGLEVVVLTRRGRRHTLAADDPALRRARWWERLVLRHRFPIPPQACPSVPEGGALGEQT
jgi:hypothetical protein